MRVLVAYGTTGGSTGEIAEWIGAELGAAGFTVDVRPAADVADVDGYDAVVLGAAVYMSGWHKETRRFAHRFADELVRRPVWLFSSGPLDASAEQSDLAPVPQAESAIHALRARGHITFGGRLSEEAHGWLGLIARRMTHEGHGGDFRNPERVRTWARGVAAELATLPAG
jgi:menaquinone-dependent protoporphyrinogen oxidase